MLLKNQFSAGSRSTLPQKHSGQLFSRLSIQRQKQIWQVLKWLIFAANVIYLYITLNGEDSFLRVYEQVKKSFSWQQPVLYKTIFLCGFLLVFANWGLEAYKWKILIHKFQRISFKRCFAAILSGSAVSLWIPNRAGEYLGRILFIKPGLRLKGVLATLVGSFAQLSVTLLLGVFGALFYAYIHLTKNIFWSVVPFLSLLFITLLLFVYFNINKIRYLLPKKSLLGRYRKYLVIYSFYKFPDLARVLSFSLVRYLVFSGQFVLFLWFFSGIIPPAQVWLAIFLIYLVQTVVPSTALTEIGIRGAASVFFLQDYISNSSAILSASYGLWLINLLLPGICGLLILVFIEPKLKAAQKQ